MNKTIARTKMIFLVIFAVLAAASWGYQAYWVWPGQRCTDHHGWWDPDTRICATPIDISTFTHRAHGIRRSPAAIAAARTGAGQPAAPTSNP